MKHIYLLLILTAYFSTVFGQRKMDLVDLYNYKHTINNTDHKAVFQLQDKEMNLRAVKTDRNYYWYSNNQLKITQGGYEGRLLNGNYTAFYVDQSLKEQGMFENGLKVGEWKKWAPQGKLSEQATFKNGRLNGMFYKYNFSGNLVEKGAYKRGEKNGVWKTYIKLDSVVLTHYIQGKIYVPKASLWRRLFLKKEK